MIQCAMHIMPSTTEDLELACTLFARAIEWQHAKGYPAYTYVDQESIAQDIAHGRHYKLLIEGEVACMFCIWDTDELIWREHGGGKAIYLHKITTADGYRGRGLLKRIIEWCEAYARERDLQYIRLDTWARNEKLKNYYVLHGFEIVDYYWVPDLPEVSLNTRGNEVVLMQYAL